MTKDRRNWFLVTNKDLKKLARAGKKCRTFKIYAIKSRFEPEEPGVTYIVFHRKKKAKR